MTLEESYQYSKKRKRGKNNTRLLKKILLVVKDIREELTKSPLERLYEEKQARTIFEEFEELMNELKKSVLRDGECDKQLLIEASDLLEKSPKEIEKMVYKELKFR